jgi:predicted NACHT family NTPase
MSSENQDMRSIQRDYIKRLLVQFASMFVRGIAFSVRDGENEVQDPVPIEIVDNANAAVVADADRSIQDREYDAALSNPALDAAVAYQAIVSADLDFDSQQGTDNVSSVLIRRSMALAELGVQRAEVSLRRARVLALRREQMQEVQRLLQRAQAAAQTSDVTNESTENVNMVISESSSYQDNDNDDGDDQNPFGLEF